MSHRSCHGSACGVERNVGCASVIGLVAHEVNVSKMSAIRSTTAMSTIIDAGSAESSLMSGPSVLNEPAEFARSPSHAGQRSRLLEWRTFHAPRPIDGSVDVISSWRICETADDCISGVSQYIRHCDDVELKFLDYCEDPCNLGKRPELSFPSRSAANVCASEVGAHSFPERMECISYLIVSGCQRRSFLSNKGFRVSGFLGCDQMFLSNSSPQKPVSDFRRRRLRTADHDDINGA